MNNPFILQKIIMTINMLEHVFYEYHEPCEARLSPVWPENQGRCPRRAGFFLTTKANVITEIKQTTKSRIL